MTVWGEMHELNNEIEPYILEVEGTSNEYGRASKGKKPLKSLRRHAGLQHYVLKQLTEHKFHFLGTSGGLDHHPFRGWLSLAGLLKRSSFLRGSLSSKSFLSLLNFLVSLSLFLNIFACLIL